MKIAEQKVELVDYMGSDLSVVNAARVSFHKASTWEEQPDLFLMPDGWTVGTVYKDVLSEKDQKLIAYLAKHNHFTPFCHAFLSFRIKAPIFVARQLVKHQVGLAWNEVSRRYVDDEPEFWFEPEYHYRPDNAKQGASPEVHINSSYHLKKDKELCELALKRYLEKIEDGVAPEEARESLPVNTMTEWIWSGSLAAWARVVRLRVDSHAQRACSEVGQLINDAVPKEFEHSWKAQT
jgi:thymidylate synthase (FAD)